MRISEIVIEVLNRLISEEDLRRLSEINKDEDGKQKDFPIPESIPREIENPVIGDLHGDERPYDSDDYIVLGSYTPMRSPGVITFYIDNITNYTGSLIRKIVKSGVRFDLELVVLTTFFVINDITLHESFHYYCDYKRNLTGAKFNRDLEEALAVAHSYNTVGKNYLFYRLRPDFINEFRIVERNFTRMFNLDFNRVMGFRQFSEIFKTHHYKAFTLKGYRDWAKYINKDSYETDFYDYIKNSQLDHLLNNGVSVNDIQGETMIIGYKGVDIRIK